MSKSILRTELLAKNTLSESRKVHVLKVISGSNLLYLSPFDSALALNILLDKEEKKYKVGDTNEANKSGNSINYKKHPLYRGAIERLISSIINYRSELLLYFFLRFSELHEIYAIKTLAATIVGRGVVFSYNTNALIDVLYFSSYHIPKGCYYKEDIGKRGIHNNEDLVLYTKFVGDLVEALLRQFFGGRSVSLNKVLIYKLLYAIARIPCRPVESRDLALHLLQPVKDELDSGGWKPHYLVRIFWSLSELDVLKSNLFKQIHRHIEVVLDELDHSSLQLALSVLSKSGDRDCKVFSDIIKDKLFLYRRLGGLSSKGSRLKIPRR